MKNKKITQELQDKAIKWLTRFKEEVAQKSCPQKITYKRAFKLEIQDRIRHLDFSWRITGKEVLSTDSILITIERNNNKKEVCYHPNKLIPIYGANDSIEEVCQKGERARLYWKLYQTGIPVSQIASDYGISTTAVYKLFKKAGYKYNVSKKADSR